MNQRIFSFTQSSVLCGLLAASVWTTVVDAGELNVTGHLNVASNLTAQSVTLGGQTRSTWPATSLVGITDLNAPVLDFEQPGHFYRLALTNHVQWVFTNHVAGRIAWIQVAQDGSGGWSNTWPTEARWPDGKLAKTPSSAGSLSMFKVYDDGVNWLISAEGANYRPVPTNQFAVSSRNVNGRVKAPAVSLSGVTELTLEYWAKLPATTGAYQVPGGTMLTLTSNSGSFNWNNVFLWGGNLIWDDIVAYGGSQSAEFSLSQYCAELMDGQWHHIAAVYDGTEFRLYLDGALKASDQASISLPSTMDVWVLSCDWFNTHNEHTAGTMDEVRVSRVARYSSNFEPATEFVVDSDTLVYLRFSEGSGTTYRDETENTTPEYVNNPPEWVEGR
jgi:hypothetical protein